MDFLSTVKGSLLEGFYPKGWDLAKIDACCEKGVTREDFWHKDFNPVECENIYEFDTLMGHEIANEIKKAKDDGRKIALILPVGPMGMYKWAVYFLKAWNVKCDHVYTFNMDEWSDADGNTLDSSNPASFEYSMKQAFLTSSARTLFLRHRETLLQRKTFPHTPARSRLSKLKAQSWFSYSVSEECAISHSGNPSLQMSLQRLKSGNPSATESVQSSILSLSNRTLSQASRAAQLSFLAVQIPSAPVSSSRLTTSSADATVLSAEVCSGRVCPSLQLSTTVPT